MGTDDAAGDRQSFVSAGISAGDNLEFSRPFETPEGDRAEASFELAFAADSEEGEIDAPVVEVDEIESSGLTGGRSASPTGTSLSGVAVTATNRDDLEIIAVSGSASGARSSRKPLGRTSKNRVVRW